MTIVYLENIIKALEKRYGEITDRGCFINDRWFSLEQVIEIIRAAE